jgi:hypothetical protein
VHTAPTILIYTEVARMRKVTKDTRHQAGAGLDAKHIFLVFINPTIKHANFFNYAA